MSTWLPASAGPALAAAHSALVAPSVQISLSTQPTQLWEPAVVAPLVAVVGIGLGVLGKWLADVQLHKREIRRDAYMDAANGIQKCVMSIGYLCNVEKPILEAAMQFAESSAPIARAQVVAKIPLIEAFSDLMLVLANMHREITAVRVNMIPFQGRISSREKLRPLSQARLDGFLAEITRYNIDGLQEPQRFKTLQANFDFQLKTIEKMNSEDVADRAGIDALSKQTVALFGEHMKRFAPTWTEVLEKMRRELGFKFNKNEFLRIQLKMASAINPGL